MATLENPLGRLALDINDNGVVVGETMLQAESLFVPKGIRRVGFSGVVDGGVPVGGAVSVASLN